MRTKDIIEGLTILEKYRDRPGGFNCGAEHDVLFAYSTNRPLERVDLERMIELGWTQDPQEAPRNGERYAIGDYNPLADWQCYV